MQLQSKFSAAGLNKLVDGSVCQLRVHIEKRGFRIDRREDVLT